jgi:hypothetical protein
MTTTRKLPDALPMQTRAAMVDSDSIDTVARTVTLVWTAGATVRRHRWEGWDTIVPFDETLVVTPAAIDLARMNAGAPVLDSHSTWSTFSQVAVVERAWIEKGEGWATIRFPAEGIDAAADRLFGLVSERIVKNISVGYTINKLRIVEPEKKGEIEQHIVERWTPHEISFVTVPADPKAQVRGSEPTALYPLDIEHKEDGLSEAAESAAVQAEPSNDNNQQESRVADTVIENRAAPAGVDEAAVRAISDEAVRVGGIAERKRAAEIRKLGKEAGEPDLADAAIDNGDSVEAFRSALLEALMKREAPAIDSRAPARVGKEHAEKRAEAVQGAILNRIAPGINPLPDGGREFRGMTLTDMARDVLEANGTSTRGMSKDEIAGEALATRAGGLLSTSDFPIILGNVVSRTLRAAYDVAPQTFRPLVRETSVSDFKEVTRAQLGEAPRLERVNEHGEYKRGSVGEGSEKYRAYKYGKIVGITREAIVNDDLDAFTRISQMFGLAAAQLESDLVWGEILSNPTMGDGTALFHLANHKNLQTAAAFGEGPLGIMRAAMAKQAGLDGKTVLNIRPSFAIVPMALEIAAEKLLNTTYVPAKTDDAVAASIRSLSVISEPRLDNGVVHPVTGATVSGSSTAYYLAASPASTDTVELAYLNGNRGVYTDSRMAFNSDGMEIKVRMEVGAKVIDWRAFQKNAGS